MNDIARYPTFRSRAFVIALLANALWVNASEIFRYFAFVMPMMRSAFPQIPGIAPMNWGVFAIWGVWDTLLVFVATGLAWLYLGRFGSTFIRTIQSATLCWLGTFVFFWVAAYNMRIATFEIMSIALPLSWLELVVATNIARWAMLRFPSRPTVDRG